MKVVVLLLALLTFTSAQSTECEKYVEKLVQDIIDFNLTGLPLPSVMYSGITTNNPGQMEECQEEPHYSYYLVNIKNYDTSSYTFTGICVPEQCTAEDIEIIASEFIHCKVYEYPEPPEYDYLTYLGAIIISIWVVILTVWSCFLSFKQPVVNQYYKNDSPDRGSINAEISQPLMEEADQVAPQDDFKIFNYYEGYLKIFKVPAKKSVFSPIFALAVLSYAVSTEFSYRQTIAENQKHTASELLNSASGVFVCNTEIALNTIIFILGLRVAYGTYKIKNFSGIGRYFFDQVLKKWLLLILMTLLIYAFMTLFTNEPLSKVWSLNYGQDCPNYMWQIWFLARNLQLDCKLCLPWISIFASEVLFTILSAPFLLIFRFQKKLGYGLFFLLTLTSVFISYAILDTENIVYEPTKLMNAQQEFVIEYQGNSFVRMGAFFTGLMLGLMVIEGLEKNTEDGKTKEYQLAKKVKRSSGVQAFMQFFGLAIMITTYLMIIPYLGQSSKSEGTYVYLILVPLFFLYGLAIFMLPSFWEGQGKSTVIINRVLGWRTWVHFDKIAIVYFMIAPMIIGFTTYSMQSSIFYDYLTVVTYMLGDLFIAYVISLILTAAFQNQLTAIVSWLQIKIFGNELKYSVLVIQQ